ncbi:MAG: histidine kinase [Acidimicrobiia bacterium]|nr:histidine kinase [Acidimicrobiia bacterium]
MKSSSRAALLVVAAGLVAALPLSQLVGASWGDGIALIALAGMGSLAAAIIGGLSLRVVQHRALRTQALAIGLVATASTVAGVLVAAKAMFISSHDLGVLLVVLLVSSATAAGAALRLGWGFERSAAGVVGFARQLDASAGPQSVPGVVVTGELQRLADALAETSARLTASRGREQALDASRRELVAWVSHDLRSPIAAIRAMAEALEEGVVSDAASVNRYHTIIRQESERLSTLVDDLFELSRITAGALVPDDSLVPLRDVIADVLDGMHGRAAKRGVSLGSDTEAAGDALVPARDLSRVLHNVIDNAVRHTRSGGHVGLYARASGPTLLVAVRDECGGIAGDDLGRVFEVAFRGDRARTPDDDGGGGLGLAIAKGLVELHAGTIRVVNSGPGCEFTLSLPLSTA